MAGVPEIRLMRERCVLCGDCLQLCPQSGKGVSSPVFTLDEGSGEVKVENRGSCIACFTCVESCRAAAIVISHEMYGLEDQPDIFQTRPLNRII